MKSNQKLFNIESRKQILDLQVDIALVVARYVTGKRLIGVDVTETLQKLTGDICRKTRIDQDDMLFDVMYI